MMMRVARILTQKYDVVCTNPPYMGGSGMNTTLSTYVKKNFPDSKSDLFACFMEKCGQLIKRNGLYAMITQHAWMFLSSYEKLREKLKMHSIVDMAHLGARAFDEIGGEVVQTTAFVSCGRRVADFNGTYVRLVDIVGEWEKEAAYRSGNHRYTAKQENFSKIPGSPVAYWVSENFVRAFESKKIGDYVLARTGMKTGNNKVYIRLWWESVDVDICFYAKNHIIAIESNKKWYPYNKGGEYRKWYGNNEYIVNWENAGEKIMGKAQQEGHHVQDYPIELKFKPLVTWSLITSSIPSFRYKESCINDIAGMSYWDINNNDMLMYILGICNTKIAMIMLNMIAPTINFQTGDISRIPVIKNDNEKSMIDNLVQENIALSKADWDSFETSWDFEGHPLV